MSNQPVSPKPVFLITKEYHRFEEFCAACRRDRYIGLCYGPPGVGKTLAARHYARWDLIESVSAYPGPQAHLSPEMASCRTVFYTPPVANDPRVIARELAVVRLRFAEVVSAARLRTAPFGEGEAPETGPLGWLELIIVEEADRLKMGGLEQLRDIYDRLEVGLILIGMPGIEKRLGSVNK